MDSSPAEGTQAASDEPLHVPRNYTLGIINGTLVQLGMSVMHPHFVLSAFIYEVTGSVFLAGLLGTLTPLGMRWPQLYISTLIEHRPRKKPYYVAAIVLRIAALAAMLAAMKLTGSVGGAVWVMVIFFTAYFLYRSAQGMGNLPFFDIVGQTIRPTSIGSFFGYRSLFGGIMVLLAGGFVVQPVLNGVSSPASYFILAAIGCVVLAIGWGVFAFAHEERIERPPAPRSLRQTLVAGCRNVVHDRNYRLLFCQEFLLRLNVLAIPFYVPYGVERFGAARMGGAFLAAFSLGKVLSSLLWGKVSDRHGHRCSLIASAVLFALSPALALLAPRLPGGFKLDLASLSIPVPLDLPLVGYMGAVFLFGAALQGSAIARTGFLLETAPPHRRASYRAFLNTALFPVTLLPMLAGAFLRNAEGHVDVSRAEGLFALIVVSGFLTAITAMQLREVRATNDVPIGKGC